MTSNVELRSYPSIQPFKHIAIIRPFRIASVNLVNTQPMQEVPSFLGPMLRDVRVLVSLFLPSIYCILLSFYLGLCTDRRPRAFQYVLSCIPPRAAYVAQQSSIQLTILWQLGCTCPRRGRTDS